MPSYPDVLAAMTLWARADPVLAAIHGGRVSSRLPSADEFVSPHLRVFDVAASPPNREYPVATPLLQWDAFAGRIFDDRTQPDFAAASDLARALANRIRGFDGHTTETEFAGFSRSIEWTPGEIVYIRGVQLSFGPARNTDPEGLARYRCDTLIRATS